jgi:CDP-diglyceride synthetase
VTTSHLIREILGTAYLLLPLLGGAAVHGLCMKYGWLAFLARPMDGDRRYRGRPLFGHSKTFRGPVLVAAGAGAVFTLQCRLLHRLDGFASIELVDYEQLPGWWFGVLAGAVAELSELPNSFVKRRLDIEPGRTARGLLGVVFFLWDQIDVLVGFWLIMVLVIPATPLRLALSVVIVGMIHPLLTVVGYLLGMRPTPR